MDSTKFSKPISLKRIQLDDGFWKPEMELVRTEVIPYQWETLNDRVPEAAPSYCMHNFKVAGRMNKEKREQGSKYQEPTYTFLVVYFLYPYLRLRYLYIRCQQQILLNHRSYQDQI